MNVFRKGDDLIVIAEVPGIKKSDLEVQVKGNTIRLAGTKSVNYPTRQACIVANDLPADSTEPSRCPSKSTGGREGRMPRRHSGVVPTKGRARQAEVDPGELSGQTDRRRRTR